MHDVNLTATKLAREPMRVERVSVRAPVARLDGVEGDGLEAFGREEVAHFGRVAAAEDDVAEARAFSGPRDAQRGVLGSADGGPGHYVRDFIA